MKQLAIILLTLIITTAQAFAYSVKVYDYWGNRVGTYKKEGDRYVLYDFNDKKVENPEDLIINPPSQKTLTNYTQYFYDENMNPIGSFTTGFWGNNGRYYPRGRFVPRAFYQTGSPSIVRQTTNRSIIYEEKYPYSRSGKSSVNIIQSNGIGNHFFPPKHPRQMPPNKLHAGCPYYP